MRTEMIATPSLGSFIVNLGRLAKIPPGESRVFQIGGQPIAVFHTKDANVLATEADCSCNRNGRNSLKTYPAMVNAEGDILVGVDGLLAAR